MPKLIQERWKCIGCGACIAVAGEFWEMAGDGKSVMKPKHSVRKTKDGELHEGDITAAQVAPNEEAVNVCPVSCIKVQK
jgi:ferredoxin